MSITPQWRQLGDSRDPSPANIPSRFDLVIVGGGASGVAVATQVMKHAKRDECIKSVAVIEKQTDTGPGLAYSDACEGTILNMHKDTMGLDAQKPKHFTEWLHRNITRNTSFPPRQQYGQYLDELLTNASEEASRFGVDFHLLNEEVTELKRIEDFFHMQLEQGKSLEASKVVLAPGDFPSARYFNEFQGIPQYFSSPWPNSELETIPKDASVTILGSRLTAIDAAVYLAEHGHRGRINFVSRSGRLPKVQGSSVPYERQYVLNCLARYIEKTPVEALSRVIQAIRSEIGVVEDADLFHVPDPVLELRADITRARRGEVHWQTILKATGPLIERYWSCLSDDERIEFLRKYNSLWMTYRHAIPLENAQKLLPLLENQQIHVLQSDNIHWNGSEFTFKIQNSNEEHQSAFLIEAIGQEHEIERIDSPLLQQTISSGLLKSHPAGGMSVDFNTLAGAPGLHVIGSMTRGVHFYTSAIDRVAAHAERIADSVVGQPPRRPLHVALFTGSDLYSNLMLSRLVPHLVSRGHTPFVFLPQDRVNKKVKTFELRELGFFERKLLQEHVLPFVRRTAPLEGTPCLTVDQMKKKYGIVVEEINSVNDKAFMESLGAYHIDLGVSLRCYQKFGERLIDYFSSPRAFWNLHPGVLPQYRGVSTAIRAMTNGEEDFGYSLHEVTKDYDSGAIIDIRTRPIDYEKSMLHYMGDVYQTGVGILEDAVDDLARGKPLVSNEQDEDKSSYYTYPTQTELKSSQDRGVRLVDGSAIQDLLVRSYAPVGRESELKQILEEATRQWYEEQSEETAKEETK